MIWATLYAALFSGLSIARVQQIAALSVSCKQDSPGVWVWTPSRRYWLPTHQFPYPSSETCGLFVNAVKIAVQMGLWPHFTNRCMSNTPCMLHSYFENDIVKSWDGTQSVSSYNTGPWCTFVMVCPCLNQYNRKLGNWSFVYISSKAVVENCLLPYDGAQ